MPRNECLFQTQPILLDLNLRNINAVKSDRPSCLYQRGRREGLRLGIGNALAATEFNRAVNLWLSAFRGTPKSIFSQQGHINCLSLLDLRGRDANLCYVLPILCMGRFKGWIARSCVHPSHDMLVLHLGEAFLRTLHYLNAGL